MPKRKRATPQRRPRTLKPSPGETQRLLDEEQARSEEVVVQNEQLMRTEAELERARDRYADLYDHAPIGYMELDTQGVILEINRAACAILGRSRNSLVNMPVTAHVSREYREMIRDYLTRACAQIGGRPHEIEFRASEAPERSIRMLARLTLLEPGVCRLFTVMFDVTERRQAEQRARALLEKLVNVQEEERRRLALNLHDQLGQQLTALKLMLGHLKSASEDVAEQRLDDIVALVEQMDRDVDFLAWELRPAALDDVGIEAALETFVRQWSAQHGVPAEFHSSHWDAARLAPPVEINVYRIAQEALNNVAKHASATQVSILLERRGDEAMLIVEDNGRGFDADRVGSPGPHGGMGLAGMRERAEMIGGTVQIETRPGKGAAIFLKVRIGGRGVN